MSLEAAIQELTQAVLMNVRSADLLSAQLAELNEQPNTILEVAAETTGTLNPTTIKPSNVVGSTKGGKVEKKLTDDELKATEEYMRLINAMSNFNNVALARVGGDKDKAREKTIEVIKTYVEDGKAITLIREVLDGSTPREVLDELMAHYAAEQAKLETSSDSTNFEDDFGDEGEDKEPTYTDEDVKKALRAYASVEGKPAAIAMLKKATGSASVAGIEPHLYAKAIGALTIAE